jgi:hypothetical protein
VLLLAAAYSLERLKGEEISSLARPHKSRDGISAIWYSFARKGECIMLLLIECRIEGSVKFLDTKFSKVR